MNARITNPTALADQIGAAATDARRVLTHMAHACHADIITTPATGWLAEQAATVVTALTNGTARGCVHVGPAPSVAHAAVWAPGRLVCASCVAALRPTPAEDGTCDRCRRHTKRLHAGAVALGPIILAYGLCSTCATTVGLTPAAPATGGESGRDRGTSAS